MAIRFTGTVKDQDGKPIAGAAIYFVRGDFDAAGPADDVFLGTTGATGAYDLTYNHSAHEVYQTGDPVKVGAHWHPHSIDYKGVTSTVLGGDAVAGYTATANIVVDYSAGSCGGNGQPFCAGNLCDDGAVPGNDGRCHTCGSDNQPLCNSNPACREGLILGQDGICRRPTAPEMCPPALVFSLLSGSCEQPCSENFYRSSETGKCVHHNCPGCKEQGFFTAQECDAKCQITESDCRSKYPCPEVETGVFSTGRVHIAVATAALGIGFFLGRTLFSKKA